jgi:hypothetical protein
VAWTVIAANASGMQTREATEESKEWMFFDFA